MRSEEGNREGRAGEHMNLKISIGSQDFAFLREHNCFLVDKTDFIKKWWESGDAVTLITRPRRFGKTLNMSMLNCFFSRQYEHRGDLFEGLNIWSDLKYRNIQGSYPVIYLSFADVKQDCYGDTVQKIRHIIGDTYRQHRYLLDALCFTEAEKHQFTKVMNCEMDDVTAQDALKNLSYYLHHYWRKRTILLLDEYDTPMQEAYVHGYWNEFINFIRGLFNSALKTNPYLERAVMTGITRVSKESVFSDLNNLKVITITSEEYADCFGFTEEEVFAALKQTGLENKKTDVKEWYDGFIFGSLHDIYNPWSITNYLDTRKLQPFWASTSSNSLVSRLIQTASGEIKERMEELLQGRQIVVTFDEQIVFDQLGRNENAIWSLLLASGYLKAEQVEYRGLIREPWYHLSITNLETASMFSGMFKGWFGMTQTSYNRFVKALFQGDVDAMNYYMNEVSVATFSFFDTGKEGGKDSEPERFYHGFVLGLLADQAEQYEIRSNRESGFGRYDVMMIPKNQKNTDGLAFILEFKVRNPGKEKSLEETVQTALEQIETKQYDAELLARGIEKERIRHYGFAFDGKQVLIG